MTSTRHLFAAAYIPRTTGGGSRRSGKSSWFFQPVIASILIKQKTLRIMSAIALLQLVVTTFGTQGWQCPVYTTVDIPCPGCGLSTATISLIRGNWQSALSIHAFAPLLVLAIASMAILSFLPRRFYRLAINRLAALESKNGLTGLLLSGFIGYWGLRFIF
jgi:hypothetical protein